MKPNRRRHGSLAARSSTSAAVTRPPDELEQRAGDGQQRVGAGRVPRSASWTRSSVGGVARVGDVAEPERGRDQRRERLDVRAHHEDVARLQRRVVLQQPDQHLAEHVDLSGRRRGRRAPARSGRRRRGDGRRARRTSGRGWRAGRAGARPSRVVRGVGHRRGDVVVTDADQERVAAHGRRGRARRAAGGRRGRRRRPRRAGRPPPSPARSSQRRGRRLRQPEVHVAELAEGLEQLDLGDRQPGVAEERQPGRERQPVPAVAQPAQRLGVPHVGRRRGHPREQAGARARPASAGRRGGRRRAALAPRRDERRSLHGVRREEVGEPEGDGVATVAAQLAVLVRRGRARGGWRASRTTGRRGCRRWSRAAARPAGRGPTASSRSRPMSRRDEDPRVEEADARAHAVATARAGAEAVGEALGQPALDALGRHHHDLLGERVVERLRQQLAEGVGELVGARCAVQVERHGAHDTAHHPPTVAR